MKGKLEEFISKHNEELDTRMPNPAVLNRILEQMQQPVHQIKPVEKKTGIVVSFTAMRWVAAACLVIGLSFVLWLYNQTNNVAQSVVKTSPKPQVIQQPIAPNATEPQQEYAAGPAPQQHRFDDVDQDIAQRKSRLSKSFSETGQSSYKKVLFDKLNDQSSPASRLKALSQTGEFKNLSNDVVDVLVETMNNDPNTNVRMAALDGLAKFYKESYVRKQLVKSLKKQQDPMVQIALIELLTRMKESAILTELEGMVKDESKMDAVRETAYSGAFQLRGS
ncbi:HEAT repeat domain-containing protein [uncultured Mucilaginibacter sp.]|uniref:HEAT repeat domain-containing protein n=1 Tax=uncultured Mucilaginibacter sp. TaxID=797541 RepID=UPI0025DCC91D|nr:HEAT repeat domain-containing protein [uncultured Mucilaginibacter sp.]